jgi:sulfite exporter TauE/SafE
MLHWSVIATAFVLGLTGGPHCVAMCGCIFNGLSRSGEVHIQRASRNAISTPQLALQAGRLTSYVVAGMLANISLGSLRNLAIYSAALKPLWTMTLLVAALLGLSLVVYARQPLWIESATRRMSASINQAMQAASPRFNTHGLTQRYVAGLAWALLPCGLLYSALMVTALANDALSAALAMAAFAIGSGLSLQLWSFIWQRSQSINASPRDWQAHIGTRLAGAALVAFSVWAIAHGMLQGTQAWCIIPAI